MFLLFSFAMSINSLNFELCTKLNWWLKQSIGSSLNTIIKMPFRFAFIYTKSHMHGHYYIFM